MRYRPSPAMVVAFTALCVALAGTATALPGRNHVRKGDIARGAVTARNIATFAIRSRHLRARNVTGSKIARETIRGENVAPDTLTGNDVKESTLATVPSATDAGNAGKVNGLSVQRFAFRGPAGTPGTNVLNVGGLALTAACNAGTELSVGATTAVGDAIIHSGGTWGGANAEQDFYNEDDDFDVGESFNPLDDAAGTTTNNSDVEGRLTYARQDGVVVTADFLAEESGGVCSFAGTVIG